MSEQPETMDELIQSVWQVHYDGKNALMTMYSARPVDLPSTTRNTMYEAADRVLAKHHGMVGTHPGETVTINKQTDVFYAERDHQNTFRTMTRDLHIAIERQR